MLARKQLINPALEWLAGMDPAEFKRWFKGSPLERTRRKRLHRNVAIAMGNSGEERFIDQLKQWSEADDHALAESAKWALKRVQKADGLANAPQIPSRDEGLHQSGRQS